MILAALDIGTGDLTGPVAALVGAIVVIGVLWREHVKADARDQETIRWQREVIEAAPKSIDALTEVVEDVLKEKTESPKGGSKHA